MRLFSCIDCCFSDDRFAWSKKHFVYRLDSIVMTGIIVAIYGSPKGMNVSNKAFSITTIDSMLINILVIGITICCMYGDYGKSKQSHWLTFSVYWIFALNIQIDNICITCWYCILCLHLLLERNKLVCMAKKWSLSIYQDLYNVV